MKHYRVVEDNSRSTDNNILATEKEIHFTVLGATVFILFLWHQECLGVLNH